MFMDVELDFSCNHCGKEYKKSYEWLLDNVYLNCECGKRAKIDSGESIRQIEGIKKMLGACESEVRAENSMSKNQKKAKRKKRK